MSHFEMAPFSTVEVDVWFNLFEHQLRTHGIVEDRQRFSHLIMRVPSDCLSILNEVTLSDPEAQNAYSLAKNRIIEKYSVSERERLKQLFHGVEMKDTKPSSLLKHMRYLAGSGVSENVLIDLWKQQLPPIIQTGICAISDAKVDKLASVADAMFETLPTPSAFTITSDSKAKQTASKQRSLSPGAHLDEKDAQIAQLQAELAKLTTAPKQEPWQLAINALRQEMRSLRPQRSRFRSRSNSRRRSRSISRHNNFCWYHTRFGTKANKCIQPCTWKNQGNV